MAAVAEAATAASPGLNKYALACAALASMNSVVSGYDVAVMSGAQLFIKDDLKINDTQLEVLAGIINVYSLVGSLAAGRTSDWLGRRYTMVLAAVIFFAGAIVMGLSPSYAVLMVGRFIAGVGVGYAFMIAPVYTSELSPRAARGFLSSFPEVFINVGVLLGYVSNYALSGLPTRYAWRAMFLVGAVPPVFLAFIVLVMPESPRWLVMQGRIADARGVLTRTTGTPEEAELRLADIKEAVGLPLDCADDAVPATKHHHGEGVWKELLIRPTPMARRILIAALGLQFFQQASGIDSVVLYSPNVFAKAGVASATHSLGVTVAVGATKTLFILVATFLLDRVGRRPLLLTSSAGMIASFIALASSLMAVDRHAPARLPWGAGLSITAVLTYVASFSIGLGPIAWVYTSEIFPIRLRAQGASLGTALNRVISGLITMTFLSLSNAISIYGCFYLYAGVATLGAVFFFFFLPETKGKSLEAMEEVFGKTTGDHQNGGGGAKQLDGSDKDDGSKTVELATNGK